MALITSWRAASMLALAAAVVVCLAGRAAAAGNKTGQVTVFWGRNKDEGTLREACDSGLYTMVIISFLDVYGHGRYHLDLSGHPLAGVGDDIKHCQYKGIPVSLSVGGFGSGYSLPSPSAALDLFERVHVRIYDDADCEAYWHLRWEEWTAAYPATRFYVGMTASEMTHGWVHPKNVYYDVAPSAQKADNYGGFMIWDRYYDRISNYTSMVKYYA